MCVRHVRAEWMSVIELDLVMLLDLTVRLLLAECVV